jgi:hypothetical protein
MAIDHYGNIYIAGTSRQTGSTNENDYVTVKYNPNGIQQWVARYDYADSFETVWSMDVDNSGNVYVAGRSVAPVSYYDGLTIKYVQAVGIEENHYSQTADLSLLEIFPNPAKSFFVVRGPLSADIKMYNVSGKLVKVEEVNTQFASSGQRFSLKGINPGVYFVRIGNQTMVKKLVVFE